MASKELTSLLLDEERLRAERSDRKTWKSRVTGLEEYAPQHSEPSERPARRQPRRQYTDEEDAEYKLALEASKYQEEEDRRKRESRHGVEDMDDDLAKALKLSEEEEARRRLGQEDSNNATSLFDEPVQLSQPTGYNQGYQQGSAVDFFANPLEQQPQQTGYPGMSTAYTGYNMQPQATGYQTQPQATGYQNGYSNGFNPQATGFDSYGQPQMQQQFQPQPTGYNPYAPQPQMQSPAQQEPALQAGSNNPWATNNSLNTPMTGLQPTATGSNNPFAQQSTFTRPQAYKAPTMSALPEQKTLSTFNQQPSFNQQSSSPSPFGRQPTATQQQPQKEVSEYQAKLDALIGSGEGQDTFGNTGSQRIPAQHTAPGTFVNSAGHGSNQIISSATGNNPFLRNQFTGMPATTHPQMPAATGPANMGMGGYGGYGAQGAGNPYGAQPQQQQPQQQQQNNQGANLIDF